ncbi:MAG TPA: pyridoxal-dependent decarboxylase [Thermoplasmata archaeon]|jgi:glutamate/tyrosine decarboxylase-like PLP-dependent enzyme|nr:pyridoxal-dependent decarboxylase [Thermoplasmata archaeon]
MTDPADRDAPLRDAAERGLAYRRHLDRRPVFPAPAAVAALAALGGPVPGSPTDPREVIRLLDEIGSPATVASSGGRYFGFVIGSGTPVTIAANWLAGAWNQNAAFFASSPVASRLEEIALGWIRDLIGLPSSSEGSFVTGATMANFTALAAARHAVLATAGWDVEEQGLAGAPPITVVVGEEAHVTLLKSLALLGLGRGRVVRVPVDAQGRFLAASLPTVSGPTIVCTQAGNVNSGAFDPVGEVARLVRPKGAWVHVDGAFGLWANAAPDRRRLVRGAEQADSWALDGHKWLNLPYDSGIVFVRDPSPLRAAMSLGPAAYLAGSADRDPSQFTPELSRRARGVEAWAAIRALGRSGIAELVERNCRQAAELADGLRSAGFEVLNEVELNQVLVSFGDDAETARVVKDLQAEGTCWAGGTKWHGRTAMRISVCAAETGAEDIALSLAAILRVARARRSIDGAGGA